MESESLTKICSLLISWKKALIWKGLHFFVMSVEKGLWTMSNWDCTSMLCILKKTFECAQCGEKGSGVQKFKNHMRNHSTQKKVYKCEVCHFETPHTGNLKRHVKLHAAVKPQKSKSSKTCEPCGKTFDRKDNFDRHGKVHLKESIQTFSCTQCEEMFGRKDNLLKHQNAVHTDKVQSQFGFGAFLKEKKVKK